MAKNITRSDLIERAAEHSALATKKDAGEIIQLVLDTIEEELVAGNSVYLGQNLGTLKPVQRAARNYRDIETGETKQAPAKQAVKFSVSKFLNAKLNG